MPIITRSTMPIQPSHVWLHTPSQAQIKCTRYFFSNEWNHNVAGMVIVIYRANNTFVMVCQLIIEITFSIISWSMNVVGYHMPKKPRPHTFRNMMTAPRRPGHIHSFIHSSIAQTDEACRHLWKVNLVLNRPILGKAVMWPALSNVMLTGKARNA
jgi:hypothetical protein